MFKDDDDLFDTEDADDLDLDLEDDDEDWDDDYDEYIELIDEDMLAPGSTVWGTAWIVVSAITDTITAHRNFWDNLRTDLAYRHNRSVDQSEFIGSVEAGIEHL
jgi:hypothetical protein